MGEDDRLKLDGDGFSREPFSEDELAKHRHMHRHYQENFLEADKFIEKTGLRWIVNFSKAAPALVKIITGMAVLGGALAWAAQRGLF